MTNLLAQHLEDIRRCLERIKPEIETYGSDEQRQLVAAMMATVERAIPYCTMMPRAESQIALWCHDAMQPVSLCINSTDLLLTDEDQPLNPALHAEIEDIYASAMKMNFLIQQTVTQFSQAPHKPADAGR